ncbi:hypothetical protein RF11_12687 [Thelohanellus kitauei]|uniref:Uncharacterized protein n=1 Tax=Thelohanellus kitauei TaxID=669202 RepID=A0A0C2MQT9_THEKT|nr:hypothetical protein RF11_12687 [Thelohanellus kitauei]
MAFSGVDRHVDDQQLFRNILLSNILEADDRLTIGLSFTLDEIAKEVMCREKPMEREDDDIIVDGENVSFEEVQRALNTVRKVMQACDRGDNEMHMIRKKEDAPADYSLEHRRAQLSR